MEVFRARYDMNRVEEQKKEFSKIVLVHLGALNRFAYTLCKSRYEADDLVSETFLKAFENFNRIKDESKIKQWLFRILNNHFISNYRSQKKFVELENRGDEKRDDEVEGFSLFEAIAKSNFVEEGNPEKNFISHLTREQIDKAINTLPEEFRDALILCDIEGFSYAEISKIINVPIGTVRSRISRARNNLQQKLWLQAQELGIKTSKSPKEKAGYTCTCGKEEEVRQPATTPIL